MLKKSNVNSSPSSLSSESGDLPDNPDFKANQSELTYPLNPSYTLASGGGEVNSKCITRLTLENPIQQVAVLTRLPIAKDQTMVTFTNIYGSRVVNIV